MEKKKKKATLSCNKSHLLTLFFIYFYLFMYFIYSSSNMDGLASVVWWLAYWPLVLKFVGSNRAEAVGFFGRKNPQHAFLWRGSKAVGPMSQLCGM
jgi:hypothetical protein